MKNQKALVTGANFGIGEACALALGAAGADVLVNYHFNLEEARRVVERIQEIGSKAIAVRADVSREEEVPTMFAERVKRFGTIDILVNNAGLQRDAAFHEMTLEEWNGVISVNLTANFFVRGKQSANSCAAVSCRSSRPRLGKSYV